jgi:ABC-2 type transport system ATP-binding protein
MIEVETGGGTARGVAFMESAIETVELTRTFGAFRAVDQLDLRVAAGTFFGFLGPNGAGKSTTIKMLTGMIRISSGRAKILGLDINAEPVAVKRQVGVVPEELALFDRLTGHEYLVFVARMYGLDKRTIRARSGELLELMDLHTDRKKLIVDYSHGMKKKLSLAAALIHDPRVLFLDEPFEGIDAVASRMVKDLLGSLVARGVTVFLTSHILEIVEKLCSEVAVIHKGKLVAQGSTEELRRGERLVSLEQVFFDLVEADERPAKTLSWLT